MDLCRVTKMSLKRLKIHKGVIEDQFISNSNRPQTKERYNGPCTEQKENLYILHLNPTCCKVSSSTLKKKQKKRVQVSARAHRADEIS